MFTKGGPRVSPWGLWEKREGSDRHQGKDVLKSNRESPDDLLYIS
jgi:hypothetical protein